MCMLRVFGAGYGTLAGRAVTVVRSEVALALVLDGVIVDQPAEQPPLALLSGGSNLVREIRVRDVVHSVDAAAKDGRIKALVLDLDRVQGAGPAHLQGIGEALKRFRTEGKPIYADARSAERRVGKARVSTCR